MRRLISIQTMIAVLIALMPTMSESSRFQSVVPSFHRVHRSSRIKLPLTTKNNCHKIIVPPTTGMTTLRKRSRLFMATSYTSDLAASGVLAISSLAGCLIERRLPNSGILTTMALAALSSSWPVVPSQHLIYELCWTLFLPGSLALLLLSSPNDQSQTENGISRTAASKDVIWDVSVPFLMASIGSVVGCILTFFVCRVFPNLWLKPQEALLAACCLCASFIGGTVNFFATARVLGGGGEMSTLMSSMAAADTFVMALYFAGMSLALKSDYLADKFKNDASSNGECNSSSSLKQESLDSPLSTQPPTRREDVASPAQELTGATLVAALAVAIVRISAIIEHFMAPILPGTACAAIATITPAVQRSLAARNSALTRAMQKTAGPLSEFTLLLFFASIGKCASLGRALRNGPSCVCFSLLALSVHSVIALTFSVRAKRIFQLRIKLEDVLVASNAAIGGPTTAAAFAGRMKGCRQRGLTMAGTVWGVVGYAIGTTLGVFLHGLLRQCVPPA